MESRPVPFTHCPCLFSFFFHHRNWTYIQQSRYGGDALHLWDYSRINYHRLQLIHKSHLLVAMSPVCQSPFSARSHLSFCQCLCGTFSRVRPPCVIWDIFCIRDANRFRASLPFGLVSIRGTFLTPRRDNYLIACWNLIDVRILINHNAAPNT